MSNSSGKFGLPATSSAGTKLVSYYAFSLFAPDAATYYFQLEYESPVKLVVDGKTAYVSAAESVTPTTVPFGLSLTQGFHQVLLKLGSASQPAFCRFVVVSSGLGAGSSVPPSMPASAKPLDANGRITNLLELRNGTFFAIPSDNRTSIPTYSDIDVNRTVVMEDSTYNVNILSANETRPFRWIAQSSNKAFAFAERAMGGEFNRYFSLALYSTEQQSVKLWLTHYSTTTVWLNGAFLYATPDNNYAQSTVSFAASQGWQSLIFKLHAPSDIRFFPIQKTDNYGDAFSVCRSKNMGVCTLQEYCPYNSPFHGLPFSGDIWAPVSDKDNDWVEIGDVNSTCRTWSQVHGALPDWSTSTAPLAWRQYVGCCGVYMEPTLQIYATSDAASTLGWAYEQPQPPVAQPQITLDSVYSKAPTVTITSATTGATIYYTTDGVAPSPYYGTLYTTPFKISTSRKIYAVAFLSTRRVSGVAMLTFNVPTEISVLRTFIVAGTNTHVQLVGVEMGTLVSFARQDDEALLNVVKASAANASTVPRSASYSGLLTVGSDLRVMIPAVGRGAFQPLLYATADRTDTSTPAYVVGSLIYANNVTVSPSRFVSNETVTFYIEGGMVVGDTAALVEGDPAYECTNAMCATFLSNNSTKRLELFAKSGGLPTNLYATTVLIDSVSCMCYTATAYTRDQQIVAGTATGISLLLQAIKPVAPTTTPATTTGAVPTGTQPTGTQPTGPQPTGQTSGAPQPTQSTTPAPPTPTSTKPQAIISGIAPTQQADGSTVTISGTFFDTTAQHHFLIYTSSSGATGMKQPVCTVTSVTGTALYCTLSVKAGTSGQWKVAVVENDIRAAEQGTLPSVVAVPPTPKIMGAQGACIQKSKDCVTGSSVHFSGINFDYNTISNNVVSFVQSSGTPVSPVPISCAVTSAYETALSCTLQVASGAKGKFDVMLAITVDSASNTRVTVDSNWDIILGEGDAPGWNGAAGPDEPTAKPAETPSLYYIIIGVLGGLVLIASFVFIFVRLRFRLVPKAEPEKELDYIPRDDPRPLEGGNANLQEELIAQKQQREKGIEGNL